MKILVVGGTGALGGHAAAYLADKCHEVSIAARNSPLDGTPMAKMPFHPGDYGKGDFTPERLRGFDAIIFAAGNDGRHIPPSSDAEEHLLHANAEAIPAFVRAAREARVRRVIQLGSFYPQAAPDLEQNNFYIRSRRLACEGARAEARPGFDVISVNAPFMVGAVPGLPSQIFEPCVAWAEGKLPIPPFGPAGGTNFMSFRSLSQALEGALLRGESGRAYLVGDSNLSFADYFGLFFKAAGSLQNIETRDEAHPLLPDSAIPQGRGNWIRYQPDPVETELLGYVRNDVVDAVAEVVAQYGAARANAV